MTAPSLFLSRARLRAGRGEALASIAPILLAGAAGEAMSNAHRIVWMLFQDKPDLGTSGDWRAAADGHGFLWRDHGDGRYLVLSRKPPSNPHGLFELDAPKEFAPDLAPGARLRFALRVNPVVRIDQPETRITGKGRETPKRKKVDVVMHALRHIPETDWEARTGRAYERDKLVASTVTEWFDRQGGLAGFHRVVGAPFSIGNYTQVEVERKRRSRTARPAGISVVDIEGVIEVTDPVLFLERLAQGFGSAKAFGCGLMLIRRA